MEKQLGTGIKPGHQNSYWLASTPRSDYAALSGDVKVDVVVVGGGITGLLIADRLKTAGKTVAVLERRRIAESVTGHTTAKITSLHGMELETLARHFHIDEVHQHAMLNQAAVEEFAKLVKSRSIDCDFQRTDAYIYTEDDKTLGDMEREADMAGELGLPVDFVHKTPLGFAVDGAVRAKAQAQFHPRKFLLALAESINGGGSKIYENSSAIRIDDRTATVSTAAGTVQGAAVVIATHYPMRDKGLFISKLYPFMAHAVGLRAGDDILPGIYYTEDEGQRSIRTQATEHGPLLIVGGGHHRSGQMPDELADIRAIESYARARFAAAKTKYFWSTLDYYTADGFPYIGRSPGDDNTFLATGFGGWGMTQSMVAATMIRDLIINKSHPAADMYAPNRLKPTAAMVMGGLNVTEQFVEGFVTEHRHRRPADLAKGEAAVFESDEAPMAAFKDDKGDIHAVRPACTHLKCVVHWNNAELTWDCPCHGSRFTVDGEVIHTPAPGRLKKIFTSDK